MLEDKRVKTGLYVTWEITDQWCNQILGSERSKSVKISSNYCMNTVCSYRKYQKQLLHEHSMLTLKISKAIITWTQYDHLENIKNARSCISHRTYYEILSNITKTLFKLIIIRMYSNNFVKWKQINVLFVCVHG